MMNLNAITIFGLEIPWTMETALFWLLVAQVVLVFFMIIVFAILMRRLGKNKTEARERALVGITLDSSIVKKEFVAGEAFESEGLIVTANYSDAPFSEEVKEYEVIPPDMTQVGKAVVTVLFNGMTALYPVSIAAAEPTEPEKVLVDLVVDASAAKTEYTLGEEFSAEGLVVKAVFETPAPVQEAPAEEAAEEPAEGEASPEEESAPAEEAAEGEEVPAETEAPEGDEKPATVRTVEDAEGYEVHVPEITAAGTYTVTVTLGDLSATYEIVVAEPVAEPEPEPVAEEVTEAPAEEPSPEVVEEPAEPMPIPDDLYLEEGEYEGGRVRYDRSFLSRLIQADAETQGWYGIIKNDALSYKKVKDRLSWKRETYHFGREVVMRLSFRGKTLCAYFPLDPADFEGSKYKVEATDSSSYSDTPCLYRIKNDRRAEYAKELFALVMARYETERIEHEAVDYSLPYESDPVLLGKKLIKRVIEGNIVLREIPVPVYAEPAPAPERTLVGISINTDAVKKEFTAGEALDSTGLVVKANYNIEPLEEEVTDFAVIAPDMDKAGNPTVVVSYQNMTVGYGITVNEAPVVEPEPVADDDASDASRRVVVVEEESYEGGTLRYDRSFTARYIQSEDELKFWYTDLKNHMLSYKRVHDRMSWKRESYRIGRDTVARLAYRGKTLCLFLALNPADFEGSKYKVEDVSDNSTYAETPCMYRLKNERRVKYAKELFDIIAANYGVEQTDREAVDYYVPYEGLLELIKKDLIKRNIKSSKDEEFFFVAHKEDGTEEVAATEEPAEAPVEEPAEAPAEETATEEVAEPANVADEEAPAEETVEDATTEESPKDGE